MSYAESSRGKCRGESSRREGRVPRYVEAEVRRQLVERDGERCTWTDERGNRCGETHFLQIDHVAPWCRGGGRDLGALRLLCGAHNRLEAERKLGARAGPRR